MREIPSAPIGASVNEVAEHYLRHFHREFYRTRRAVKRRAMIATVGAAIATGLTAVLASVGAAITPPSPAQIISIVIAGVGAAASVLAAWDAHFQHRQQWIQKTATLSELTALQVWFDEQRAIDPDDRAAAGAVLTAVRDIFGRDASSWQAIQESQRPQDRDVNPRRRG
jgi:hypothetical protein